MSELRPCPFCGGEAAHTGGPGKLTEDHIVSCIKCNAQTEWHDTKDAALAAWNRRAPDYAAGAEAMREAAAKMAKVFPASTHGALPVVPYAAALQAAAEIAAAIRALPLPEPPK